MALIVDAGALYAQADVKEPRHAAVTRVLLAEQELLVTSELAVAEADYLILTRLGVGVELAFIEDLAQATFSVACLSQTELRMARDLVERYRDLRLGLSDASLAILAYRYQTQRILTFDERAFRQVTPLQGGTFLILPADVW
ncbi:MAG TPA: PIN domain-containing protein [Chloroflexota bacterium]|nr:PIN domain-containing protein [Chloroflexota bacterium]